jgi:hypothetical protein
MTSVKQAKGDLSYVCSKLEAMRLQYPADAVDVQNLRMQAKSSSFDGLEDLKHSIRERENTLVSISIPS